MKPVALAPVETLSDGQESEARTRKEPARQPPALEIEAYHQQGAWNPARRGRPVPADFAGTA
jgi:hypothetical protein